MPGGAPHEIRADPASRLIELMIVVAIIAILAAIAIAQYQDYAIRAQISEGASLADGVKSSVAEYYKNMGRFGSDNESFGLAPIASISGRYVPGSTLPTALSTCSSAARRTPTSRAGT